MAKSKAAAPVAERVARILFGAVVVPFFTGLTLLFMEMRAAAIHLRPKSAPPDIAIVAITFLVAMIAAYGLDQLLTGIWPGRRRWFARAEEMSSESLGRTHGGGSLTVGRIWGAPIRVHWSLVLGLLALGGIRPGAWVGFVAVILVHELGHAVLARRFRLHVVSMSLHALGGECRWMGNPSAAHRTLIAWGGVAGQAVLLVSAGLLVQLAPHLFTGSFGEPLGRTLIHANAAMAVFNLLPIPPLDGAEAWQPLLQRLGARRGRPADPIASMLKSVLDDANNQRA